ncbi:KRAB-A domain-containing protein 2-like [Palaemon carinicauda]|uniref:KRAB-A domain-containing protein 2-like n=1 Tax=Palaemon carinicauda TaxID=392227 RepID=UPI0035B62F89
MGVVPLDEIQFWPSFDAFPNWFIRVKHEPTSGKETEQKEVMILDHELTAIDKSSKKVPHEYYLLKKYEILKCGDVLKLIRRRTANEDPIYFATLEDTFDIIKRAHIATGHGGRDKMVKELSKKYANITHDALSIYKSLCIECQCKCKRPTTKGTVVRPILTKNFSSRSQVDLVDMQAIKQGNYKWIMVY